MDHEAPVLYKEPQATKDVESERNSLPQRSANQLIRQYQMVNPENICTSNITNDLELCVYVCSIN